MNPASFALDSRALLLLIPFCVGCYFLYLLQKKSRSPQIQIPSLKEFIGENEKFSPASLKEHLVHLPYALYLIALSLLLLAFMNPRWSTEKTGPMPPAFPQNDSLSTEGLALYLVLDRSGSMTEKVTTMLPDGRLANLPKTELLKTATRAFVSGDPALRIKGRTNDLIGLVEFARTPQVLVPLTLERQDILKQLDAFKAIQEPEQNGTAIGYAILKTAEIITGTKNYAQDLRGKGKPAYEIKGAAIILVTDGFQDPHPDDKNSPWRQIDPVEAAKYAKEHNIRLYIINVEPSLAEKKYEPNLRQMENAADLTGGKFFLMSSSKSLLNIYQNIDRLEKSPISLNEELSQKLLQALSKENLPEQYDTYYFYPILVMSALLSMLLALYFETTVLRRVP